MLLSAAAAGLCFKAQDFPMRPLKVFTPRDTTQEKTAILMLTSVKILKARHTFGISGLKKYRLLWGLIQKTKKSFLI
jgi:hypothetical protein